MKKKVRLTESQLQTVIGTMAIKLQREKKSKLAESKNSHFEVEQDFEIETENGDIIEFTLEGTVTYGDFGIGSYEYWGSKETDTQMGFEVDGYDLKEGSYDPQFKGVIIKWVEANQDKIREKLELKAEEQGEQDYDYENEYNPDDNLDENKKTTTNMKKRMKLTESQVKTLISTVMLEQQNEKKGKKIKLTESQVKRLAETIAKSKK